MRDSANKKRFIDFCYPRVSKCAVHIAFVQIHLYKLYGRSSPHHPVLSCDRAEGEKFALMQFAYSDSIEVSVLFHMLCTDCRWNTYTRNSKKNIYGIQYIIIHNGDNTTIDIWKRKNRYHVHQCYLMWRCNLWLMSFNLHAVRLQEFEKGPTWLEGPRCQNGGRHKWIKRSTEIDAGKSKSSFSKPRNHPIFKFWWFNSVWVK